MIPKVTVVESDDNAQGSFRRALNLIGETDDLQTIRRSVAVKPGIFNNRKENRPTVNVVNAIINSVDKAPKILSRWKGFCVSAG